MNILHLASEYPPQRVYGLGRFVRDLAEEQVRQGHTVTVVTNSMGGQLAESHPSSVRVLRVDFPPPPKPPSMLGQVLVFNLLILKRVFNLGVDASKHFDCVCSHDWLTAMAAQAIQDGFGTPHICTFHDTIHGKRLGCLESEADRCTAAAERWTVHTAMHVIANSAATKEELVANYQADPEHISVVPCAIAPGMFPTTSDSVRLEAFRASLAAPHEMLVLYVGRLDPEKGVPVLLEAFARAGLPDSRLCIAGSGELAETLKEQTRARGIAERVSFLGYVEHPVLPNLYRCADILVCPSLYEPFGLVVLEAMLQGTPVIASNTGGLRDLVEHGKTGMLVAPGKADDLAEALQWMSANVEARMRMGQNAHQTVLNHRTWVRVCAQTVQIYNVLTPVPRVAKEKLYEASQLLQDSLTPRMDAFRRRIEQTHGPIGLLVDPVERLPLAPSDASGRRTLSAFRLAMALVRQASHPPKTLFCTHWSGVLAASLANVMRPSTSIVLAKHNSISTANETEDDLAFEREMWNWAAQHANVESFGNEIVPSPAPTSADAIEAGPRPNALLEDRALLRGAFADPEEFLAAVPLPLNENDNAALVALATASVREKMGVLFLVVGDCSRRDVLRQVVREKSLPIRCTGDLPPKTLCAVVSAVDAVVCVSANALCPVLAAAREHQKPVLELADDTQDHGSSTAVSMNDPRAEPLTRLMALLPRRGKSPQHVIPAAQPQPPVDLLLYNDWGLGDELMLSAVARELKRAHPGTRIWVRSRHGFRFPSFCETGPSPATARAIETIYQNPVLYGPNHHAPFPGHLVQQMLDKVALDTGLRATASDTRPEVVLLRPIRRDARRIVLHCRPNKRLPSKDWGLERWKELCGLLHRRGLTIVQLGDADEPLLPYAEDQRGLKSGEVPDAVASAAIVICLVGFLMHVAAATRTPAIVLFGGREHPVIDGYPDHFHLCSEPLECRGRWGCHLAPDVNCPHGLRCMNEITPERVDGLVPLVLGLPSVEKTTCG